MTIAGHRKNLASPRFGLRFTGWTVPVNLTNQTRMPQASATRLTITNLSDGADEPATVSVLLEGATDACVIDVPPLTTHTYPGKFTELTSRGGTGAAGVAVVAFWADEPE